MFANLGKHHLRGQVILKIATYDFFSSLSHMYWMLYTAEASLMVYLRIIDFREEVKN